MIFLFIEIYIYLTYPRILVFEKCHIVILPYPYRSIRQPYRCNLGDDCIFELLTGAVRAPVTSYRERGDPVNKHGQQNWARSYLPASRPGPGRVCSCPDRGC
jgi:hypothetical protein